MVVRACRIGLLLMPLLAACGTGADFGDAADAATSVSSGIGATTQSGAEDESASVESPCFRNPGVEAWTCSSDGVTLTRARAGAIETVHCRYGCVSLPSGFDDQCRPRYVALGSTVNDHAMTDEEASWVSYFAWCAVPLLRGTRDDRLTAASTVAWWALKEGVLDQVHSNAVGLSLCGANRPIGPLDRCAAGAAWQVGASGVQASGTSLTGVARTAAALFPAMTEAQLLAGAAAEAGYPVGNAENLDIVGSRGKLRASWLLHVTALGFFHQAPIVTEQCITKSKYWCYGRAWPASAAYAPDKPSAMRAMGDLRAILDMLSP